APSALPPGARPLAPSRAREGSHRWRHPQAPTDSIGQALVSAGVPVALATEIAAHFTAAPDWPGSLRGHDREPGGLRRHTARVLARMIPAPATWPPEAKTAAAVVAAAHDLGKLVAYRRGGAEAWVGAGAAPRHRPS